MECIYDLILVCLERISELSEIAFPLFVWKSPSASEIFLLPFKGCSVLIHAGDIITKQEFILHILNNCQK